MQTWLPRTSLVPVLLALSFAGCAHRPLPAPAHSTYTRLLEYEGVYEYENDQTLRIAASPREPILVAVLMDAKYPLRPAGPEMPDTFVNLQKQRVVFKRDGGVTAYSLPDGTTPDRVFRRLSTAKPLPLTSWYPRPPSDKPYRYRMPKDLKDGLPVRSLDGTGLEQARLEDMVRQIAGGQYPDLHSVLILKSGALVLEEYFYEYDAETLHPLRSATKSFVSALAGIAIDKGLLPGVKDPVLPHFKDEYADIANLSESKRAITLEHLLTNSSGLDCDDRTRKSPGNEERMGLTPDWVKHILDLPMVDEPGKVTRYCSGGVITTGRIVEKAAGVELEAFARQHLFEPLGIRRFHWSFAPDRSSTETFCQLSLRPRDMAKFGLLFQRGGEWGGRQVVPKAWVETSTATHVVLENTDYGYLWWRPYLDVGGKRHHAILATGNGGQKIYLWPELDMIVVLTGGAYNRDSRSKELLTQFILPAAP